MTTQNFILYRTGALLYQPPDYIGIGNTDATPRPVIASPAGEIIAIFRAISAADIIVPDTFSIAADPDRAYKIGDIYSATASTTDSSGAS